MWPENTSETTSAPTPTKPFLPRSRPRTAAPNPACRSSHEAAGRRPERAAPNFNIKDDAFDATEFKYVTREKFLEIQRSEIASRDLLMSTKGTLGNVCMMPDLPGPAVLSASGTVRLRLPASAPLLGEVLVQQMIQPSYKEYIRRFEGGSIQKYLNLSGIRKMEVNVPPMARQQEFLKHRDRLRQLTTRTRQAAGHFDALFNSLTHRAFTGQL